MFTEKDIHIPATVPKTKEKEYIKNYMKITRKSGRLMLFAGDQKVEHLNNDFYGKGIDKEDSNPEHFFKIAQKAHIGAFASQLGFISRYGRTYNKIPYVIKLNSKTNLVKTEQDDPLSRAWYDVSQIVELKKSSGLDIVGVGYTIYLGSEYESIMLRESAQIIYNAHKEGLITILWIYPRGKAVKDEKDSHLIAGAAGVAAALGSDFVKLSYPENAIEAKGAKLKEILTEITDAAGRTKVVFAGGPSISEKKFLTRIYNQIHLGNVSGSATGRNIHQKSTADAVNLCNAIYDIVVNNKTVAEAMKKLK